MKVSPKVKEIYKHVLDYQRKNGASSKCLMNSIFYFDILDQLYPGTFKVVCGILHVTNANFALTYKGTTTAITKSDCAMIAHVWIEQKGPVQLIHECSAEFVDLPRDCKKYYTYQEFTKVYDLSENKKMLANVCALNVQVAKCIRLPNAQNQYYKELRGFVQNAMNQTRLRKNN